MLGQLAKRVLGNEGIQRYIKGLRQQQEQKEKEKEEP